MSAGLRSSREVEEGTEGKDEDLSRAKPQRRKEKNEEIRSGFSPSHKGRTIKYLLMISNCRISSIYFDFLGAFAALRENVFNRFIPPYPQSIPKPCISRVDFELLGVFAALRENVFNRLIPLYPQLVPEPCISKVDSDLLGAFARGRFSSSPSVASF